MSYGPAIDFDNSRFEFGLLAKNYCSLHRLTPAVISVVVIDITITIYYYYYYIIIIIVNKRIYVAP